MNDSFETVRNSIKSRKVAPIYLFHGEESFFTDRLVELLENYLPEHERAFNLFSLYPLEKEPEDVMEIARRFPLMAEKIVVIVKEAQTARGGAGKWINRLAKYAANPNSSTILAVVARGTKVACKEFTDNLKKNGGVIVESAKLRDDRIPGIVTSFIKDSGLNAEPKAVNLLVEHIGNDLSKLYNEVQKLKIILPPNSTVTPESVEKNIGISREYNNYELTKALSRRDAAKALGIIRHFNSSQRENPWVLTLGSIYSLFANILAAFYSDRTDRGIMEAAGARSVYAITDIKTAMNFYSPSQVIEIISLIRKADSNAKGNGSRLPTETIMENLILEILMATGIISN